VVIFHLLLLASINVADSKLSELKLPILGKAIRRISGPRMQMIFNAKLSLFHITTAYNILRMTGVPIGKRDFMMHLVPFSKQSNA